MSGGATGSPQGSDDAQSVVGQDGQARLAAATLSAEAVQLSQAAMCLQLPEAGFYRLTAQTVDRLVGRLSHPTGQPFQRLLSLVALHHPTLLARGAVVALVAALAVRRLRAM